MLLRGSLGCAREFVGADKGRRSRVTRANQNGLAESTQARATEAVRGQGAGMRVLSPEAESRKCPVDR